MKKTLALLTFSLAFNPFAFAKTETLKVDVNNSNVKWEGRKIAGTHHGLVKLKGGKLEMNKNMLVGGEFELDMSSLTNEDVTDKESNTKLTNHLKSDDFFSVEKNPTAKFKITKVEKSKDGKHLVTGDLTIKGITNSITFPAEVKAAGGKVQAVAKMEVDRTKWDIKYRSGKFFPSLGDKVIKDEFGVDVNLQATK